MTSDKHLMCALRRELVYYFELDAFLREHGYMPKPVNVPAKNYSVLGGHK